MQILVEARSTLEDCARTTLEPLATLEQEVRELLTEVQRQGGRVRSDAQTLAVRARRSVAEVHQKVLDTQSLVTGTVGPGAHLLEQSLTLLQREEITVVAAINATVESHAA